MPWDVDDIPDEWWDVINGVADELPEMVEMVKAQENMAGAWLKKQGYRSYLSQPHSH